MLVALTLKFQLPSDFLEDKWERRERKKETYKPVKYSRKLCIFYISLLEAHTVGPSFLPLPLKTRYETFFFFYCFQSLTLKLKMPLIDTRTQSSHVFPNFVFVDL